MSYPLLPYNFIYIILISCVYFLQRCKCKISYPGNAKMANEEKVIKKFKFH